MGAIEGEALTPSGESDLPLAEVSGLATGPGGHGPRLTAIGDATSAIAAADLDGSGAPGPWEVRDVSWAVPTSDSSLMQFEAIAVDGAGTIVISQEDPSRLLVVDPSTGAVVAEVALDLAAEPALERIWHADPNSRGESLVLLPAGRALVVKEKRPMVAVLFAPTRTGAGDGGPVSVDGSPASAPEGPLPSLGDGPWWDAAAQPSGTLQPVAVWPMGKRLQRLGDISDAAIGPDGALYLLSDQTATIARVPALPAPGDPLKASHVWPLATGGYKCEGLAFAPDGSALVGVDTRKPKRNLVRFERWL